MTKEEKNEIWIRNNDWGSFLDYKDNNYGCGGETKDYNKQYLLQGKKFYEIIDTILSVSDNFYDKGVELKFEKDSIIEIPKKETIEKLIKRLEELSLKNRDLKYSLKIICELSKDEKSFSKYKIIK